jgi:hypothetical protein
MCRQERLDELARLVDHAAWGLSAEPTAAAVSAEYHALAAVDALCAAGAQRDGGVLDDSATDPRADLATAAQLLDQLPAAPAEQSALLAAAAHIRQASRTLAGR